MPNPKRRQFVIRQKQKAREKRNKLIRLSENERKRLRNFKIEGQWEASSAFERGRNSRTLKLVNDAHGRDFEEVVRDLARKFPKESIRVLDEGAGNSSFGTQLVQRLKGQVRASVEKTDIHSLPAKFRSMRGDPPFHRFSPNTATGIREMLRQSFSKNDLKQMVSPEELVERFGRDKFHLIVSTFGGIQYTEVSRRKAIANIIAVLKPGGIASIATGDVTAFTQTSKLNWEKYYAPLLKRFKNIRVSEKTVNGNSVLTIEKLRN